MADIPNRIASMIARMTPSGQLGARDIDLGETGFMTTRDAREIFRLMPNIDIIFVFVGRELKVALQRPLIRMED